MHRNPFRGFKFNRAVRMRHNPHRLADLAFGFIARNHGGHFYHIDASRHFQAIAIRACQIKQRVIGGFGHPHGFGGLTVSPDLGVGKAALQHHHPVHRHHRRDTAVRPFKPAQIKADMGTRRDQLVAQGLGVSAADQIGRLALIGDDIINMLFAVRIAEIAILRQPFGGRPHRQRAKHRRQRRFAAVKAAEICIYQRQK